MLDADFPLLCPARNRFPPRLHGICSGVWHLFYFDLSVTLGSPSLHGKTRSLVIYAPYVFIWSRLYLFIHKKRAISCVLSQWNTCRPQVSILELKDIARQNI